MKKLHCRSTLLVETTSPEKLKYIMECQKNIVLNRLKGFYIKQIKQINKIIKYNSNTFDIYTEITYY